MAKSKGTKSSANTPARPKPSTSSGGGKLKPASLGSNDRGSKGSQGPGTSRGC